jgi:lipopolysaccharide transport system ATP-binding protein
LSTHLVELKNLSKSFPTVSRPRDRINALFRLLAGREIPAHLRADILRDITLSVPRGESLGIIGENGAGKSTLLKLLTGVLQPTRGTVKLHGTVGALLELGAGFHPELTGRQNIDLAGTLSGFSARQIREQMDQIIAFADIGRYIDEPVKHYSSGMVVRLGFGILVHRKPDLLITDEVLAVGDESFQKKCVQWIEGFLNGGGTLILVSHSMYHVQKLCRRALWLKQGQVQAYGDVFDVTQDYLAFHERKSADMPGAVRTQNNAHYRIVEVRLDGDRQEHGHQLLPGASLRVDVEVHSPDDRPPHVLFGLLRADGTPVYGFGTEFDQVLPQRIAALRFGAGVTLDNLPLLPGHYHLRCIVLDPEGVRMFDTVVHELIVRGESREMGMVRLPYRWHQVDRA